MPFKSIKTYLRNPVSWIIILFLIAAFSIILGVDELIFSPKGMYYMPAGYCGDGSCDSGEDSYSCPSDCSTTGTSMGGTYGYCGDYNCDPGEDSTTCPTDCTTTPSSLGPSDYECYDDDGNVGATCTMSQGCCDGSCFASASNFCCTGMDNTNTICVIGEECCSDICYDNEVDQCCDMYVNNAHLCTIDESCCGDDCIDPENQECCMKEEDPSETETCTKHTLINALVLLWGANAGKNCCDGECMNPNENVCCPVQDDIWGTASALEPKQCEVTEDEDNPGEYFAQEDYCCGNLCRDPNKPEHALCCTDGDEDDPFYLCKEDQCCNGGECATPTVGVKAESVFNLEQDVYVDALNVCDKIKCIGTFAGFPDFDEENVVLELYWVDDNGRKVNLASTADYYVTYSDYDDEPYDGDDGVMGVDCTEIGDNEHECISKFAVKLYNSGYPWPAAYKQPKPIACIAHYTGMYCSKTKESTHAIVKPCGESESPIKSAFCATPSGSFMTIKTTDFEKACFPQVLKVGCKKILSITEKRSAIKDGTFDQIAWDVGNAVSTSVGMMGHCNTDCGTWPATSEEVFSGTAGCCQHYTGAYQALADTVGIGGRVSKNYYKAVGRSTTGHVNIGYCKDPGSPCSNPSEFEIYDNSNFDETGNCCLDCTPHTEPPYDCGDDNQFCSVSFNLVKDDGTQVSCSNFYPVGDTHPAPQCDLICVAGSGWQVGGSGVCPPEESGGDEDDGTDDGMEGYEDMGDTGDGMGDTGDGMDDYTEDPFGY